jgi:outer membrane lipoprotein SlyB
MKRISLLILAFGLQFGIVPGSQAQQQSITLPVGTEISISTIDRINSKQANSRKEYAANLDDPVIVDGVTVIPAKTTVYLRVSDIEKAGYKRRASLSTSLVAVMINGQRVDVNTDKVNSESGSQVKRTATGAAVGAGTGAAIGGAVGGGAGAGIGAGIGAAGGAVAGKLFGKAVEIAPETRFTYTLTQPVVVDYEGPAPSEARSRPRVVDVPAPPSAALQPAEPAPPAVTGVQVPTGTAIIVRMIDSVDSNLARVGQTFRAGVDESVLVDGQTVIPRGADALVKLVEDQESGKFEGKTILTLALTDVTIGSQSIDTATGNVSRTSGSRGARSAKVVGGATALGAIIGALAGGGRGAAIGAASGAAVGGAAEVLTKGQRVKIPSETRLTFTLQQPIEF